MEHHCLGNVLYELSVSQDSECRLATEHHNDIDHAGFSQFVGVSADNAFEFFSLSLNILVGFIQIVYKSFMLFKTKIN